MSQPPGVDRSGQGSGEPALGAFPISPDNVAYLPQIPRAVYIGGAGNMAVIMVTGEVVVFVGLAMGTILPIRPVKIFSTGTTASNLVGLY